MSYEHAGVGFYDSETNSQFRSALIDSLIMPAYHAAASQNGYVELQDGVVMADFEQNHKGNRIEYEFFAEISERTVTVSATYYSVLDDLTEAGAQLISKEIQASHASDSLKEKYADSAALRRTGEIETFTRRNFQINLSVFSSIASAYTDLGYSVDGHEIDQAAAYDEMSFVSELQGGTRFGADEIEEIVRALLFMKLITQADVKQFLDQF